MALHTILGANGTIATELVPLLLANKQQVRLVSRKPASIPGAESMAADVLNRQQVFDAVKGSDVVYLLVGLQYDHKVWRTSWPILMRNTIDACKAAGAKLVFFDNAYMYGKVDGRITEDTPFRPVSKKGKIRVGIDQMVLDEIRQGALTALIAKAVDFYGPRCTDKSAAGLMVFERMLKGQTPQWFCNINVPRAFNYTPDAARALYILATDEKAYGQTWHLPVVSPALTGREFVALAAKHMQGKEQQQKYANGKSRIQIIPSWLVGVIGWFNPFMREMHEMMYQNAYPFQFDSTKFEKAYQFTPTPYEEAIKATAEWFRKK